MAKIRGGALPGSTPGRAGADIVEDVCAAYRYGIGIFRLAPVPNLHRYDGVIMFYTPLVPAVRYVPQITSQVWHSQLRILIGMYGSAASTASNIATALRKF
jgi:hypothetical protein